MRQNPLKKIVELQKQGKSVGIYSVCSANGYVIEAALKRGMSDGSCVLIESTANQCDQNGTSGNLSLILLRRTDLTRTGSSSAETIWDR